MRNIIFIALFYQCFLNPTIAQPGFCGAGYSTFFSANILFTNNLNPTLDGQILPLGSHVIAVFQDNGKWKCAGFIQWNGNAVSMVVNGNDGNLPGYAFNEAYKYIVQLPDGCLIDSVSVSYDVSGVYTNPGNFQDGGLSKLSTFHSFSKTWLNLDATNGLCGNNTASIEALVSPLDAPNTFTWSNGDTTASISNLANGQYTVTATNAYGCTSTSQASVSNIPVMSVQLATEYQFSVVACQSIASVSGGTSPFVFVWSNGQNASVATNLPDGDFTVTVTDANSCTSVQTDHCTVSSVSDMPQLTHFSVSPNPSDGPINIDAAFSEQVDMRISIYTAYGVRIFFDEKQTMDYNLAADLSTFPSGLYFVVLHSNGRTAVEQLIVF